ncbi:MAG: hypothetical protein MPW14_05055 [Candidatus Manganitrophus sp.]|nr:MAG: hypothetical protein MPW14_05055 [Candidatus Manganitrophus sp.]
MNMLMHDGKKSIAEDGLL